MNVGKYVKEKRIQLGISLRQLSYKIGMSHTNISDFEKGQIKKKDTLIRIIDGLGLSLDERSKAFELFGEDEISPKVKNQILELEEENNILKQENIELKIKLIECENKVNVINHGEISGNQIFGNVKDSEIKIVKNEKESTIDTSGLTEEQLKNLEQYIKFLRTQG